MNQLRPQKVSNGKISKFDSEIAPLLSGLDSGQVSTASLENRENRLDSWKEIAVYLDREVRTVQRWEKREHLPVHRHLHQKISSIFAFRDELDNWRKSRSLSPDHPVSAKTKTDLVSGASLVLSGPSGEKEPVRVLLRSARELSWAWANVDSVPAIIYFSPDALAPPLQPHSRQPVNLAVIGIASRRGTLNLNTRSIATAKS